MGGAPEESRRFGAWARHYVNKARTIRDWEYAANHIGYASHFLTDVGQPMHTGRTGI